jgi:NAD(P)-dependent dehydrogenase (short-subunit alcohol dehydrogenase family)
MTRPWALITGASYGVGRAVAVYLSEHGFNIALTSRNKEALQTTADRLDADAKSLVIPADMSKIDHVETLGQELQSEQVSLDAFVHCAFGHIGEEDGMSVENVSPQEIADFIDVSVTGSILITRSVIPLLRSRGGRAVFVVADWGFPSHNVLLAGTPEQPIGSETFNAAKHAMTGFVNSLERLSGVRATGIYPGIIASANQKQYPPNLEHEGYLELHSTDAEAKEAGYDIPQDAIPLEDIAKSVHFALTTRSTVRALHLKPVDFWYTGT